MTSRKFLHSWKEIANYTGRGVRTLQRYEVKLGFPVHRPAGTTRSAVLAFTDGIDAWLSSAPKRLEPFTATWLGERNGQHSNALEFREILTKAKCNQDSARAAHEYSQRQRIQVQEMIKRLRAAREARQAAQ